jgi:Astacin (Peptidase family M12A)
MGIAPKLLQLEAEQRALIPANASAETVRDIRGVLLLSTRWPQNAVLTVCFLSGSRAARNRVVEVAREWNDYINLSLDFGAVDEPRRCKGDSSEHIKVGFVNDGPDSGYWSYVGTQSLNFAHSANLGGFGGNQLPARVSAAEFKGIVLHEFGHALGLQHEHQSPAAGCDSELDSKQVTKWAVSLGWNSQDVAVNIKSYMPSDDLIATNHDKKSIMHYSMPAELFKLKEHSKCWVPKNNVLSPTDKAFITSIYPRPVAELFGPALRNLGGEQRSGGSAAEVAAGEKQFQTELVQKYEVALAKAGTTNAAALVQNFRRSVETARQPLLAGR